MSEKLDLSLHSVHASDELTDISKQSMINDCQFAVQTAAKSLWYLRCVTPHGIYNDAVSHIFNVCDFPCLN